MEAGTLVNARAGYAAAIATLADVADRTGSGAARYWADYLAADPDQRAPAEVTGRPHIRVEPGMRFGGPQLRGISTDAIAGLYLAERDEAAVCDDYDISRHELLVVLWFEGEHGCGEHREALGAWAKAAYRALARGEIDGIVVPV